MTKNSTKHPFNEAGQGFMVFILLLYLWTTITVICEWQNINPLKFSIREQYSKIRGID